MLHAYSSRNEWVVESSCTNHLAKDASLFSSLGKVVEHKIYVTNDFAHDIARCSDIPC